MPRWAEKLIERAALAILVLSSIAAYVASGFAGVPLALVASLVAVSWAVVMLLLAVPHGLRFGERPGGTLGVGLVLAAVCVLPIVPYMTVEGSLPRNASLFFLVTLVVMIQVGRAVAWGFRNHEIGRGAMGTVFEAIQESLGRRVALKVLPGSFALDPKRVERFRREARATARVHHPSIVPVYEVGESGGTFFYAMEYIDGPALSEALDQLRGAKSGKLPGSSDRGYVAHAVAETAQLAEGLHQAHRQGLVHRDVKPSNVLVDSTGRYILVDFGLVREEEAETLTRSGEMVGTVGYMSPEQVSRRRVDARSDVYGLAATLYEILTLRRPFGGETEHEIQTAVLFEEPVPPRKLDPKLSRDLETILLRGLEKNPERRYPSAAAFAEDLRLYLKGEPIRARPVSRATRLARRLRRHRAATAAAAVCAVVILIAALVLSISRQPLRLVLTSSRSVTPFAGLARDPALSPDGRCGTVNSPRTASGSPSMRS